MTVTLVTLTADRPYRWKAARGTGEAMGLDLEVRTPSESDSFG